jgi:hypothetical protein
VAGKSAPGPDRKAAVPAATAAPASSALERLSRAGLLVLSAALGAAVGFFGSFGHRAEATWLGVAWPTGLALALGGLVGLLLGVGELLGPEPADSWRPTRLSAVGCISAGWLLALLWLTYFGPPPSFARKGDAVLPDDWRSLAYLLGGMALVTAAMYRAWVDTLAARISARSGTSGDGHPKG